MTSTRHTREAKMKIIAQAGYRWKKLVSDMPNQATLLLLLLMLVSSNSLPTSLAQSITTQVPPQPGAPTTSTTSVAAEPEESTLMATDSLAVNLDESTGSLVYTDEPEPATTTEESGLLGIEPKSISGAAPNSVASQPEEETSGKLSYEAPSGDETTQKPPVAPARINVTRLDQLYMETVKDEQATVDAWRSMEKKLKRGVGGLIGSMVPFALNMSQEAKIGSECSGAMLKWVLSMNQLKSWALRMLDASGKPVAGLLEGSLTMFGNYRQCLKIRAPDDDEIEFSGEFREYFRGKYCVIQAKPWLPEKSRFYNLNSKLKGLMEKDEENPWYEKTIFDELSEWALAFNFVNIRMDICVPSLCSREDLNKAINFLLRGIDLKARVLRCEMDAKERPSGLIGASSVVESSSRDLVGALAVLDAGPSTDRPTRLALSETQNSTGPLRTILGWLLVPGSAIILVLVATCVSFAMSDSDDTSLLDDNDVGSGSGHGLVSSLGASGTIASSSGIDIRPPSRFARTINSISLKRSLSSHMKIDYDQLADDKPLALYGFRFILILWVILVESAVNLKFEYLRELLPLKDLIFWWPMQVVINSSLQFDSFILLTGFTMAYKNVLNDTVKGVKTITKFVLDKYIRLMPSIMIIVALVILMPLAYSGPVWNDYVTRQSAVCQSNGWLNTVFLQNYLPYKEICLPQTWLLCIELQLVFLMAPLVYYLNKSYMKNIENNKLRSYFEGPTMDPNKKVQQIQEKIKGGDANRAFYWVRTMPGMVLIVCILAGLAGSFYNVYVNQLPPGWFYTMADPDSKAIYFGEHMMRLWTHLAVFSMGVLAGVECRRATRNVQRGYRGLNLASLQEGHRGGLKRNKSYSSSTSSLPIMMSHNNSVYSRDPNDYNGIGSSISINILNADYGQSQTSLDGSKRSSLCRTLLDVVCCLLAVATMLAIIFSTHDWSLNELPKPLVAGAFDVASRFLWSSATIWFLYLISVPNEKKKFSLVARALGHPLMVSLGKLSFLIYIIYPVVHTAVLAIQEQPIYSSWLMLFHILIGNLTITVILASLVSLFVEMPCRNLFRRCGTSLLLTHTVTSPSPNANPSL